MHRWLYKCNQYFDIEDIDELDKLKLASYYLDGIALYWHQNFMRNIRNQRVSWGEYVEALCYRFGGQKDPMEDLIDLKQVGTIETYIHDFDVLWNKAGIGEKQALVIFLGGLELEIKNTVKMFEPKDLRQAFNLARLQENTLTHRQSSGYIPKHSPSSASHSFPSKTIPSPNITTTHPPPNITTSQVTTASNIPAVKVPSWPSSSQNSYTRTPNKPIKSIKNQEFEERRLKGLCFWCDDKFVPGHRCRNKRLYSLSVLDEEEENTEEEVQAEEIMPHISLNALEGTVGFHTMKVTGKTEKQTLHILVDSGSTHNFLTSSIASKLQSDLTSITPITVQAANGGKMSCESVCKGLKWKMQGVNFEADVFIMDLNNYDMVLGIQWLSLLGDILCNYKHLWMSFDWQGQRVLLRGENPIKFQAIKLEQLKGLLNNQKQLAVVHLCSLRVLDEEAYSLDSMTVASPQNLSKDPQITELMGDYQDLFQEPEGLPPSRSHDHFIPLKDGSQPINLRLYRYSGLQKDVLEKMIEEMLGTGIIRSSNSPFASPVVLVKKKDSTWWLCVDYRALNRLTIKDKYPIPVVEELLEELVGATIFSKIDLRSGYHQIRMGSGDEFKTAFRTHNGHYEFLVMPFGLTNAPVTFQSLMNEVFRVHLRKFILVFFDDILIYSKSSTAHYEHLRIVFKLLRIHQLVAKASKCSFGSEQVEYLGHIISKAGVATDPDKIKAILDWPLPRNLKQLRGFLGLTSYYRRFVKGYRSICKPLTQLLKKDAFGWNSEATTAFTLLKAVMTTPPVLSLPDLGKLFVVETDASMVGVGAVLMQEGHPIAYLSKALGLKQQAMSIYEKEMLAILHTVHKWRHYLWGKHFKIRTDHVSLKYLLDQKIITPMQHQWLVKLMGYDYEIEYRQGKENVAADALSRPVSHEIFAMVVSSVSSNIMAEITTSWQADPYLLSIIQDLQSTPDSHPHYSWVNGHLNRKGKIVVGRDLELHSKLISLYHSSTMGGHSGVTATAKRVGSLFYWKGQQKHIRQFIRECSTCQRNKHENIATPGLLQPLPVPHAPFIDISMDFVEGLPKSEGKDVIMVVVDRFSKYAHFMSLSHPFTASLVAKVFMDNIYKLHGLPASIVSDRDPIFLSRFWKELFTIQGVNLLYSSAYHPQTDGQTEIVN